MSKMLEIGSISVGTLLPEDVIPALADVLRDFEPGNKLVAEVDAIEDWDVASAEGTLDELWADLTDALQDYVPPYCYVGSIEGDGADIGCWFSSEAFEQARADGEIFELPDGKGPDSYRGRNARSLPAGIQYLARISGHGNVALYTIGGREVLSIV